MISNCEIMFWYANVLYWEFTHFKYLLTGFILIENYISSQNKTSQQVLQMSKFFWNSKKKHSRLN